MHSVQLGCANGDELIADPGGRHRHVPPYRPAGPELPLVRRPLGDELAEELRRLDADQLVRGGAGRRDRPRPAWTTGPASGCTSGTTRPPRRAEAGDASARRAARPTLPR